MKLNHYCSLALYIIKHFAISKCHMSHAMRKERKDVFILFNYVQLWWYYILDGWMDGWMDKNNQTNYPSH